jgi:diguanylate cyclase (GGDEF)-like protein
MKAQNSNPVSLASGRLRWLLDPGAQVPAEIREILLRKLLGAPEAVAMGALDGLIVNVLAFFTQHLLPYAVFAALHAVLGILRFLAIRAVNRAAPARAAAAMDANVALAIAWSALVGGSACVAMVIGTMPVQILNCCMVMAVIGPICARNYAAPRLATLLICLCDIPFIAGAALSGDRMLLVMLPMTPPFLFSVFRIVKVFQKTAIAALLGEHASQRRARSDQLTGLLNRHGWAEAASFQGQGMQTDVLMCLDLDGFKQINDTLGHHAGDSLLCGVARRLEEEVRRGDIVARFGGDEFVILAHELTPQMAQDFAERLIARVANEPYLLDAMQLARIGVSIGFACAPDDGTDTEDLHRKADGALYAAKAAGKGVAMRFSTATPSIEKPAGKAASSRPAPAAT